MQKIIHTVMLPKAAFLQLGEKFDCADLVEPHVVYSYVNDRTGHDHSKEEIESAVWTSFLGNIDVDAISDAAVIDFYTECLALGFSGCWEVYVLEVAAMSAKDTIVEASRREQAARKTRTKLS